MLALAIFDRQEDSKLTGGAVADDQAELWRPSVYTPPRGVRAKALTITVMIFVAGIGAGLIGWSRSDYTISKPSAPLVMNLLPLASPASREPEQDRPVSRKREKRPPITLRQEPVPKPVVPLPGDRTPSQPMPAAPEPAPVAKPVEDVAPKAIPAPPAPQVSSNTPDTSWQGRVLARLGQYRRYPFGAQNRREQGVPYIRFVIDRDGKVLSSRLERSSGFPDLDREAVSLPKRAQPLPKPPPSVAGDTIEVVVPVEFLLG